METRLVAYYRVSTSHQGIDGYGMDAQRKAVADYLGVDRWRLAAEYTEVESGKRSDRPELMKAIAACKKHRAKLVIAKLDRLSRNVHFISGLMERKVDFIPLDMPNAKPFELHIRAALCEEERRQISERTKAGLAVARARGVKLGGPALPALNETRRAGATARAQAIAPVLVELAGMSHEAAAVELNARKVATATGAPWSGVTVARARARLAGAR
jgi:DNA invertase Pin-like site-specific DNA recombinase